MRRDLQTVQGRDRLVGVHRFVRLLQRGLRVAVHRHLGMAGGESDLVAAHALGLSPTARSLADEFDRIEKMLPRRGVVFRRFVLTRIDNVPSRAK